MLFVRCYRVSLKQPVNLLSRQPSLDNENLDQFLSREISSLEFRVSSMDGEMDGWDRKSPDLWNIIFREWRMKFLCLRSGRMSRLRCNRTYANTCGQVDI